MYVSFTTFITLPPSRDDNALLCPALARYGSLCWRPEESFAGFETFDGEIVGWKRLFAQRVCTALN